METYFGIIRKENPDWLGWVILDLISEMPDETEEHRTEMQVQIEHEVRDFYFNNKVA